MAEVHLDLLLVDVSHLLYHERGPPVHLVRRDPLSNLALRDLDGLRLVRFACCLESLPGRRPLPLEAIVKEHEHGLLINELLVAQLE